MLEALTAASFRAELGSALRLEAGEQTLQLLIVEVGAAGAAPPDAPREPFAVRFRGPADPRLPQGIYRLRHARLGALELFVVPIGRDGDGVSYEAVFG